MFRWAKSCEHDPPLVVSIIHSPFNGDILVRSNNTVHNDALAVLDHHHAMSLFMNLLAWVSYEHLCLAAACQRWTKVYSWFHECSACEQQRPKCSQGGLRASCSQHGYLVLLVGFCQPQLSDVQGMLATCCWLSISSYQTRSRNPENSWLSKELGRISQRHWWKFVGPRNQRRIWHDMDSKDSLPQVTMYHGWWKQLQAKNLTAYLIPSWLVWANPWRVSKQF